MKMSLFKITPVSIVCVLGFIYLITQVFTSGKDKSIFAYIIIFIIFLAIAFAIDRFLVSKFDYRKMFVTEFIFLVVSTIGYLYANSTTMINVETNKNYFFVVYDNAGLKKDDIPTKGLFDKTITISADSNIHINTSLEYDAQLNPPQAWNYTFISKKLEAVIDTEKIVIGIYARHLNEQETDAKLQEEIRRLQKINE